MGTGKPKWELESEIKKYREQWEKAEKDLKEAEVEIGVLEADNLSLREELAVELG